MTVESPDVVDSVSLSADESVCILRMIEDRPFSGSPEQNQQLVEKINAYLAFLQTGQLVEQFPQMAGKRMEVRLVCGEDPQGPPLLEILQAATALFAKHGADFVVEVIPWEMVLGGPAATVRFLPSSVRFSLLPPTRPDARGCVFSSRSRSGSFSACGLEGRGRALQRCPVLGRRGSQRRL